MPTRMPTIRIRLHASLQSMRGTIFDTMKSPVLRKLRHLDPIVLGPMFDFAEFWMQVICEDSKLPDLDRRLPPTISKRQKRSIDNCGEEDCT